MLLFLIGMALPNTTLKCFSECKQYKDCHSFCSRQGYTYGKCYVNERRLACCCFNFVDDKVDS